MKAVRISGGGLLFLALLLLVSPVQGCDGGSEKMSSTDTVPPPARSTRTPPPVTATGTETPKQPTDRPRPTATSTRPAVATVEPKTPSHTDLPPTSPQEEPELTATNTSAPADLLPNEPSVLADLREELYFSTGGGGWPGCDFYFDAASGITLPAVTVEVATYSKEGYACLYGFPLDEEITIDLRAPDGQVSTGVFSISVSGDSATAGGHCDVLQIQPKPVYQWWGTDCGQIEGVPYIDVGVLWFPVGMPEGEWSVEARSPSAQAEGQFTVDFIRGGSGPVISAAADGTINPFRRHALWERRGVSLRPGDRVFIRGAGFPANENLPLAFYHVVQDEEMGVRAALVHSEMVVTDNQGDLEVMVPIDVQVPCGEYYAVVVTTSDDETSDPFRVACP